MKAVDPRLIDLTDLVERFEALGRELFDDGVWTCGGGAVVFKHLCDVAGLRADLCVGLYWWDEADLVKLQDLLGRDEGDDWLDEHHHWVVVHLDSGSYLVDPNGELRGQPRLQPLSGTLARYRADDHEGQWSGIYSYTTPLEVAVWDRDVARALGLLSATK